MSILNQKTISKKISLSGVGLHTGRPVDLNLLPSAPNTGIVFKRTDLKEKNIVIPTFDNVVDATLCTKIIRRPPARVTIFMKFGPSKWLMVAVGRTISFAICDPPSRHRLLNSFVTHE